MATSHGPTAEDPTTTTIEPTAGPEPTPPAATASGWARRVDRLTPTASGARVDRVSGRRLVGPLQGFGQLWQKTFRVRLDGVELTPAEVVGRWKEAFPTFWPKGNTFYAPFAGIAPGEVALLEVQVMPHAPLRMSTGVMVIYADEESFTFMNPEGHALSAWITFSAFRDGDTTVAQVQALERTADPLIELSYLLGANRYNDAFWVGTLENLGRAMGVAAPSVEFVKTCVDKRRQWRYVTNVRHSPAISTAIATVTAPARWLRDRTAAR
jgi:hypothetical protein